MPTGVPSLFAIAALLGAIWALHRKYNVKDDRDGVSGTGEKSDDDYN
jgi:hypothetical protein